MSAENPRNFCRSCGKDFSSLENFDRHRVGKHEGRAGAVSVQGTKPGPPKLVCVAAVFLDPECSPAAKILHAAFLGLRSRSLRGEHITKQLPFTAQMIADARRELELRGYATFEQPNRRAPMRMIPSPHVDPDHPVCGYWWRVRIAPRKFFKGSGSVTRLLAFALLERDLIRHQGTGIQMPDKVLAWRLGVSVRTAERIRERLRASGLLKTRQRNSRGTIEEIPEQYTDTRRKPGERLRPDSVREIRTMTFADSERLVYLRDSEIATIAGLVATQDAAILAAEMDAATVAGVVEAEKVLKCLVTAEPSPGLLLNRHLGYNLAIPASPATPCSSSQSFVPQDFEDLERAARGEMTRAESGHERTGLEEVEEEQHVAEARSQAKSIATLVISPEFIERAKSIATDYPGADRLIVVDDLSGSPLATLLVGKCPDLFAELKAEFGERCITNVKASEPTAKVNSLESG